jgi:hypothetical protein
MKETLMKQADLDRCFINFDEAVQAAGLAVMRHNRSLTREEMLSGYGAAVRRAGAHPAMRVYEQVTRHKRQALVREFRQWDKLPEAFREFAEGKPEWEDVVRLLEDSPQRRPPGPAPGRRCYPAGSPGCPPAVAYGSPLGLPHFAHAPLNEQGVVLLFGQLAPRLGYCIAAAQAAFPDCEALRQTGPGLWQRLRIEFEYESRNFAAHGHPPAGCDLIVCWRHNWPDCPVGLEVLELSREISRLPSP